MPKIDGTIGMNVYLPVETYRKFRIQCLKEGKTVKSVVIDFVKEYVGEEEIDESERDRKTIEKEE